jgi:hypothetical protein
MQGVSSFYGTFPISFGEIMIFTIIAITFFLFVLALGNSISKKKWAEWRRVLRFVVVTFSICYIIFFLFYSINFYREPIKEINEAEIESLSDEVLAEAFSYYIAKANEQAYILENNLVPTLTFNEIFTLADASYYYLPEEYRYLTGVYGTPKRLILSDWQTSMGYSGMFFPFTGEPYVNGNLVRVEVPFVTTHEIAHQRGIAKEYEANYIAFLSCINSPNIFFRYSGYFNVVQSIGYELKKRNMDLYNNVANEYGDRLKEDLEAVKVFWRENYDPKVGEKVDALVEANLKNNGEEDGLLSYGKSALFYLDYYIGLEE